MSFKALAKQVIWLVMVVSFVRESEPRHAERGGSRRTPMAGSSVHAAPQHGRIMRNPATRSSPIVQCTIRVVIDTVGEFNVLGSASEVSEPFTNARLLAAASLVKRLGGGLTASRRGCSGGTMDFLNISAKLTPLPEAGAGDRSLARLPG